MTTEDSLPSLSRNCLHCAILRKHLILTPVVLKPYAVWRTESENVLYYRGVLLRLVNILFLKYPALCCSI